MNSKKLMLVLGLAGILSSVSLAACQSNVANTYTLREYLAGDPSDFNPHTWETNADNYPAGYCEMGLVDIAMDTKNEGAYQWVYEMADKITNVTKELEFQTDEFMNKWGIAATDDGRVYKIELNKNAQWEDGTPINADTYIESMKRLLDPAMQNYRANTYYSGETGLVGADGYIKAGSINYVGATEFDEESEDYNAVDEENYYINWPTCLLFTDSKYLGGKNPADFGSKGSYASYGAIPSTGENAIDKYPNGTVITTDVINGILASNLNLVLFGGSLEANDVLALFGNVKVKYAAANWDNVGLLKEDDYTLIYINLQNVTPFYFNTAMTSNWIVKTDLYDSLKDTSGALTTTTYGTAQDKYMSYGPYKMESFEDDKQIKFVRNDKWYGYTDGKHEGQYKTDAIICDIIPEHNTAMRPLTTSSTPTKPTPCVWSSTPTSKT